MLCSAAVLSAAFSILGWFTEMTSADNSLCSQQKDLGRPQHDGWTQQSCSRVIVGGLILPKLTSSQVKNTIPSKLLLESTL